MKRVITIIIVSQILFLLDASAQSTYTSVVNKGHDLRRAKEYSKALTLYQQAFRLFPDSVKASDVYFEACSMSMAGKPDSALVILGLAANRYKLTMDSNLQFDECWADLKKTDQWQEILKTVIKNKEDAYTPLQKEMLEIQRDDQIYRQQINSVLQTEGPTSKKIAELNQKRIIADSINLIKTEKILDQYGWPSPAEVGNTNQGLFLVIQHATLSVQLKYLPMFREAVKTRYFFPPNLALLEDRVAIEQGKKQIYGSQISYDAKSNSYHLLPIEDEAHVNDRRAKLGLEPLAEYLKHWNIAY